jgi:hypothetical protein
MHRLHIASKKLNSEETRRERESALLMQVRDIFYRETWRNWLKDA